jgi:hypothetical protein
MAGKATKKAVAEDFITYVVVKPHDGLEKGEELRFKAGHPGAEYCVSLGLWKAKVKKSNKE